MIYNPYSTLYRWPEDPTPQSEMPTGQIVRDPATMSPADIQMEMAGMSPSWPGRVPGVGAGLMAGLGGIPLLGPIMSSMAQAGMRNRMDDLFRANQGTQIAGMYPGTGLMALASRDTNSGNGFAGGLMDNRDTGGHQGSMAQAGLGDWSDEFGGFGGA